MGATERRSGPGKTLGLKMSIRLWSTTVGRARELRKRSSSLDAGTQVLPSLRVRQEN